MKKSLLTMALATLLSPAMAIENGQIESASAFPSLVEMNCTGTIIAGKWVLTAAHCSWPSSGGIKPVNLVGAQTHGDSLIIDPLKDVVFNAGVASDIALWELSETPLFDKTLFLSNDAVERNLNSTFTIYGFGQTQQQLHSATYSIDNYLHEDPEILFLRAQSASIVVSGDSGSPYLLNGKIVGITRAAAIKEPPPGLEGENYHGTSASRISFAQDWILETVNAWHYPTIATVAAGQSKTIEVQSLHMNAVVDSASRTGDIEIDIANSSCINGGAQIQPFDICTYTITSKDGYEATLDLGNDQRIVINKGKGPTVTPPTPEPEAGGSSGGSAGWLSLLGLLALAYRRKG
ncbi:MAG: trypsin-like serine protease [Shewanella sp.]